MFADYVLPMGHGPERHDTQSYEQYGGKWLGFRQPVRRVAMEQLGQAVRRHPRRQPRRGLGGERVLVRAVVAHRPGRVAGDPQVLRVAGPTRREDDGRRLLRLRVRQQRARVCPRRPPTQGLTPLEYMRRYGVFEVAGGHLPARRTGAHRRRARQSATADDDGRAAQAGHAGHPRRRWSARPGRSASCTTTAQAARVADAVAQAGALLARRWSTGAGRSMRRPDTSSRTWRTAQVDAAAGELVLMPTFRLPTMIHTRSGNAKYLNEISNTHPLWMQHQRRRGARPCPPVTWCG